MLKIIFFFLFLICLNQIFIYFYLQMDISSGKNFTIIAKLSMQWLFGFRDPSVAQLTYKKGERGGGGGGGGSHSSSFHYPPPEPQFPCATS